MVVVVRDISSDPIDLSMVKAIHEVAKNMDMTTIAEYVEDEITFQILKEIGVDYGQGYGIAKPISLADFRPTEVWQARLDSIS